MPSSKPNLLHILPAATFLTTHSTGAISSLLTRLSVSLISSTKCVAMPSLSRYSIMKPLNLLLIVPLPSKLSIFFPSKAEVSSR